VRNFALHRIQRVTVLDEAFTPEPGFSFKKYMANAFSIEKGGRLANVAIRFAPRQARWIRERPWHRSARIQERIDGGCVLRMRVKITSELRRWVMQFGEEAEVLAPKGLREGVADDLAAALDYYRPRRAALAMPRTRATGREALVRVRE
jgi:predicted DNA-binding transcriptional regulator YafY